MLNIIIKNNILSPLSSLLPHLSLSPHQTAGRHLQLQTPRSSPFALRRAWLGMRTGLSGRGSLVRRHLQLQTPWFFYSKLLNSDPFIGFLTFLGILDFWDSLGTALARFLGIPWEVFTEHMYMREKGKKKLEKNRAREREKRKKKREEATRRKKKWNMREREKVCLIN